MRVPCASADKGMAAMVNTISQAKNPRARL
jgi:hypothetical protein